MRIFNKDNIEEQVNYINKILRSKKKGLSRIASEDFKATSEELLQELQGFGYIKVKNQFVLEDNSSIVGQCVGQNVRHEITEAKVFNDSDDLLQYKQLMSNFNVLMEIIEMYKNNNAIPKSDIVVQLPYESDKNYKTSIRIHKEVFEEFKLFCSKNKEFTQKELISMALVEYMEKYKKV